MLKIVFTLIFGLFATCLAIAQKADTAVFFLKDSGVNVSTIDSADYILQVISPDSAIDKNLFKVSGYYKNGKIKFIASSLLKFPMKLDGSYLEYFPNGHKKALRTFRNNFPVGEEINFYPNGRIYNKVAYREPIGLFYVDCLDSLGNVLTKNGNGHWVFLSNDYETVIGRAVIKNRLIDHLEKDDHDSSEAKKVDMIPQYPGGLNALGEFLRKNIRYPETAKKHRTQGKVLVMFIIERDGALTDIKVSHGIGDGCDQEAMRVIGILPKWRPGYQNGKPVRVQYTVPISFTLNN